MSNEMISVPLLPCPFCGQRDFLIERLDSDASVVICQGLTGPHEACLARGPVGVAQDEGEEQPGRDKAVELWNARAAQAQGEPVAWTWDGALNELKKGANCISVYRSEGPGTPVALYTRPAEQPAPVAVVLPERLQQILKFLEGAENLDGHWFGEPGPTGQIHWWRAELRKALEETNLFANQQ